MGLTSREIRAQDNSLKVCSEIYGDRSVGRHSGLLLSLISMGIFINLVTTTSNMSITMIVEKSSSDFTIGNLKTQLRIAIGARNNSSGSRKDESILNMTPKQATHVKNMPETAVYR